MSNEDSKARLLNILKWLEAYQGCKSQADSTSTLSIEFDSLSGQREQSSDDNNIKQCRNNPLQKSPCQDSTPAIVKDSKNISISLASTPDNGNCDRKKLNCALSNVSNTCEIEHSSAMQKDTGQVIVTAKLGLEVSDVQTANTFACSKGKDDKSISKNISANGDILQECVDDEISENLQTGRDSSSISKDVSEENITISKAEDKILEVPLHYPDNQNGVISKSESVVAEQNTGESNSNVFSQDFDDGKTVEKQSLEKVVTEVDSDKIPAEQLCRLDNSNESPSGESGRPLPRIENVLICPQTDSESTSNSTGLIDPLVNKGNKINRYGSLQSVNQSKYSIVPNHQKIRSNLNPNDNPQTVLNSKNTNTQYLGEKLGPNSNSVKNSSSVNRPSTSSIVEETQKTIKSNQMQRKSLKEHTFSTARNTATNYIGLSDSDEVIMKRQVENRFIKTGPNYTDLKVPEKLLKTSSTMDTLMNVKSNVLNPTSEKAEIYRTSNVPNYNSVYDSGQFKCAFVNARPYSSNTDCRQIPEQCYQENQPLYYANIAMNRSSDVQYVFYPNSVNSSSSMFCNSPQFHCGPVNNYIDKTNDDVVRSSNTFSNHQITNLKPFSPPYMLCLQKTPATKSVGTENTNINGNRDFLETCQPLQNSNVPEMTNQEQYAIMQNAVLTSAQQRQQQLCPNVYKGNQSDYLVYKTNRSVHDSNDCIKNFNRFMSAQELNSQINNPIVKYPSNPYNPDIYQFKLPTNIRPVQFPTADSGTMNVSHTISNTITDNGMSPKQHLTQDSFQPRIEPMSRYNGINERLRSNVYLQENKVKSHSENDRYNKTTRCSVNSLKDNEINRKNRGYPKPSNYTPCHSTINNMCRSSFNTNINSDNSLPQYHQQYYNSESIQPDNFKSIMSWFPKPTRRVPCDPLKGINKCIGDSTKIPHLVQEICSSLSTSEIKKNGNVSENGQFLQNQLFKTSQPLLSQNIGHQQNLTSDVSSQSVSSIFEPQNNAMYTQPTVSNEHNDMEMSTKTTQNDRTEHSFLDSFNTSILSSINSLESQSNCLRSEYPSVPRGNYFQNINTNDPLNVQQIPESKLYRAENLLQELTESNFSFLDNDFLKESLIDEGKPLSTSDGKYDGSKSGQSSDMMSDELFLFSDYDPVFLASLLTNDLDSYHDYNSAFDEVFEDAASITMANSVQSENSYIENDISNVENSTQNPDNFRALQNSESNQHINLSNIPTTSVCVRSVSINDSHNIAFHDDNQMEYCKHPNEDFGSSVRKPVCTRVCPTPQSGIMSQRYPSETATYQCTPGHTIYAADMVPRIDIDPHIPKRINHPAGFVMGPSALVSEEKKSFSYDPEVTKRFSDRCASKTAYQLAESISEYEINRGRYVNKSRVSKENNFRSDDESKLKDDGRSSMCLSNDNGEFSCRGPDDVGECSTETQLLNIGLTNISVTSCVEKTQCKTEDVKEGARRPRGRPRLSEETKRERAILKALQVKTTPKTRIKKNAKMDEKEKTVQQVCNPTNNDSNSETVLNLSNDSQQHKSEITSDEVSQIHSDITNITPDDEPSRNKDGPSSSVFKEQLKQTDDENESETALQKPNLNIDRPEAPLQLTNEKHLEENGENVSEVGLKENGWFDECSNLSQEERQMKSYFELKKKLNKRQKTNNAPWKCPYLKSKSTNDKSRRKFSKRKCVSNYNGSTKRLYPSRDDVHYEKQTATNEDDRHGHNNSCSEKSPKENNLNPNETMDVSNRNELSSTAESHATCASEQTKPQNKSKTLTNFVDKRHARSMPFARQKPALFDKQNRSQSLSDHCKTKSPSPIAVIHPCIPLPIYPPPPPPLFRLPPPPPPREKKVTPRNVNPAIVGNARLCYEGIKHQLSKAESDFDSFLISYANIVQGLQNSGAERYRRIKDILLKTSEIKAEIGDKTSSGNKGIEHPLAAADISENGGEAKDMDREFGAVKVLSDIDALSIQGDSPVNEEPLDRNEFSNDYTELVKIILTSRADEYRNIKLVISRNICGGADMKQIASKNTNQAELEAKKAKLAAYFKNVGKMVMMGEEKFGKVPTKSRGTKRKSKRNRSIKKSLDSQNRGKTCKFRANSNLNFKESNNEIKTRKHRRETIRNLRNSDLEEAVCVDGIFDKKVCDKSYNRLTGKLKKNSVGRPRKNTIKENPDVLNKPRGKKEEGKCYSEKEKNLVELSSSSDDGFVEESTGDYILGLGTESDDDNILFNSINFQTHVSENNTKCLLDREKSDSKENSTVLENCPNVVIPTNEICQRSELKEITPAMPQHTLRDRTKKIGYDIAKRSPVNLNTRISRRKSSRLACVCGRKECCCDLSTVDGDHNKTGTKIEPSTEECISSFKKRNQSKIVKPKTAIIPKKESRQRKRVKNSQKVYSQSKLQGTAKKIYDKPVKDSYRTGDDTNIPENSTKSTIITETTNERKTLKNACPTEPCTDQYISPMFIDSGTEMSEIRNIDSDDSWKAMDKNRKLKEKHSPKSHYLTKSNSVNTLKYFSTLRSPPSTVSEYGFRNKSSKSCFLKENIQKTNMSLKDYIPNINNSLRRNNNDDDDDDDDDCIMGEVLISDSKGNSTNTDDNTPRSKYKRHKRTNVDSSMKSDLSVPSQKIAAENNKHSENCTNNFEKSLDKSNERKDMMNLNSAKKSSKSGSHSRRNYNWTFQKENTTDVNVSKLTNSTEVLNISKMEHVTSFSENTADDSKLKDDEIDSVCQNQSTIDDGAKHSRLSSELIKVEKKKRNIRKGGRILKIQSINFEEEPILLRTTKLLKGEGSFETINENKNIFNILFQAGAPVDGEAFPENQIESKNGLGISSSNSRDGTFGQYSKSDVNLIKIWDSKSSKLPVIPKHWKNNRLNAGDDRKTLVVNCCRLETNSSNSHSLQSSEYTDNNTNSETKTKPNSTCKGILKNTNASSEKGERRINKVRFSIDNDGEETNSRKKPKLKIHLTESNYKERYCKIPSAVKTSKSGENSKKRLKIDGEYTHEDCDIEKLESTTRTAISKNLDSHEDIPTHVGDIVSHVEEIISHASNETSKSTRKGNHGNSHKTSRKKKKRPPLVCNYCSKQFKKPSQLLYHTRIHTGERPFKCDVCEKTFVSNSHLLRHSRTHSSVKSHICDTCGRGFSQRYSLMMHESIHSRVKPFKCQKCSVTFRTRDNFVVHERKYHPDQTPTSKTK